MGRVTRRIFKTRINIGLFKVGEVLQACSGVIPPASISSTWLTVIRIPRIVGSPRQTSGLIVIRSICMRPFYKNRRRTQSDSKYGRGYEIV